MTTHDTTPLTKEAVEREIRLLENNASDCHVRTETVAMLRALSARVEAVTSDRHYIVGHVEGWEAAIDAAITVIGEMEIPIGQTVTVRKAQDAIKALKGEITND